jgi:photosystem II stability/assembly factor-like uncharacterized protein
VVGALALLAPGGPFHVAAGLSTTHPTASPTVWRVPRGGGWTRVGPAFGETVAFSLAAPTTLYVCGTPGGAFRTGPTSLGVSHDSGETWQTLPTPGRGATCTLRVSPTNPNLVALFVGPICGQDGCTSNDPEQLYVSTDGGQQWTKATFPDNGAGKPAAPTFIFAWTGVTLFALVGSAYQQSPGVHYLAASRDGGPFAWVDGNGLSSQLPAQPAVVQTIASSATFYIVFSVSSACSDSVSSCLVIASTRDSGDSWRVVTPRYTGTDYPGLSAISITSVIPGTETLVGFGGVCQCARPPFLRSTDGGATWRLLSPVPAGASPFEYVTFATPDGTLFSRVDNDLVTLPRAGQQWSRVAPAPPGAEVGDDLEAVTWDAKGQVVALWASSHVRGGGIWSYAV